MVHGAAEIDFDALSQEEQLDLLDRLWERVGRNPELLPLTAPQVHEVDDRSDELDRDRLLGRFDKLAKALGVSRAALIERGLEAVLAGSSRPR